MTKKPHPNSHAARLTLAQEQLRVQRRDNADMMERIAVLCGDNDDLRNRNSSLAAENIELQSRLEKMTSAAAAHEHNADEYAKLADNHRQLTRQAHEDLQKAKKAEAEARSVIERLKRELLDAEMEAARQRGYIQRVTEDDVARETRCETQRTEVQNRRTDQPMSHLRTSFNAESVNDGYRGRSWISL